MQESEPKETVSTSKPSRIQFEKPMKMERKEYMNTMFRLWGVVPLRIIIGLLIVGLLAGVIIDVRWILVCAMIVLIALPMVMLFLYYYYGLLERCYFNATEHSLTLDDDGILITMNFKTYNEDVDSEELKQRTFKLKYDELCPCVGAPGAVIYPIARPTKGFLWLPVKGFKDYSEFQKAMELIKLKKENENIKRYQ